MQRVTTSNRRAKEHAVRQQRQFHRNVWRCVHIQPICQGFGQRRQGGHCASRAVRLWVRRIVMNGASRTIAHNSNLCLTSSIAARAQRITDSWWHVHQVHQVTWHGRGFPRGSCCAAPRGSCCAASEPDGPRNLGVHAAIPSRSTACVARHTFTSPTSMKLPPSTD